VHALLSTTFELRCVVCRGAFDFAAGETALVLRHVAYGHDFVHDGACATAASELIFPEPGFDCAAFARDPERQRVLSSAPAEGWTACVLTSAGRAVRSQPLQCWVLVARCDGTTTMEGLMRDAEWLDEPGGAEFAVTVQRIRVIDEATTWLAAA